MRADRLLALLMLLQTRGRMSAQTLARELEVSERTIYRDILALNTAGVPVYTERGPGGGCELLESYRTNLTGLNADEARALFMLSIPAPLDQLGVSQELKAALLKLSAALPAARRQDETRTRQRIHLDSSWWFQSDEAVPHLQTLQQALWQDRKLRFKFRSEFGAEIELTAAPYGLVAKANIWYLVYTRDERLRVVRVSHIVAADVLAESFVRPAEFNLADFWISWCQDFEQTQPFFSVVARVAPALLAVLPWYFGEGFKPDQAGIPDASGWVTLTLPFESFEAARARILGFGRAIEVLEPVALRRSVLDFAEQIVDFYAGMKLSNRL